MGAILAGVDMSAVQRPLTLAQWQTLAGRIGWVGVKCGSGNNPEPDPDCAVHVQGAHDVGLPVLLYHFLYIGLPDSPAHPFRGPADQAKLHAQMAAAFAKPGDLRAFGDFEWPRPEQWDKLLVGVDGDPVVKSGLVRPWCREWLDTYASLTGVTPGMYFDEGWMRAMSPTGAFASSPAWIASWGPRVAPIFPWAGWSIWQTSGGGGILPDGAPVDTDLIADAETFDMLTGD